MKEVLYTYTPAWKGPIICVLYYSYIQRLERLILSKSPRWHSAEIVDWKKGKDTVNGRYVRHRIAKWTYVSDVARELAQRSAPMGSYGGYTPVVAHAIIYDNQADIVFKEIFHEADIMQKENEEKKKQAERDRQEWLEIERGKEKLGNEKLRMIHQLGEINRQIAYMRLPGIGIMHGYAIRECGMFNEDADRAIYALQWKARSIMHQLNDHGVLLSNDVSDWRNLKR